MRVECKTEEEFREHYLAILTNHPYPKAIQSQRPDGSTVPVHNVIWDTTIAEEQGFGAFVVTKGELPNYLIGFCRTTLLTGYFPKSQQNH